MQLYMVRHAHAGQRRQDGRDIYRTLSTEGRRRADELVEVFAGRPIDRLLSSPATRCAQTLGPLAADRRLEVEEWRELWEGSDIDDVLRAMERADVESVVACTHGDIIPAMIDSLSGRGMPVSGRGCGLGSIWVLEFNGGHWRSGRYVGSRDGALT